MPKESTNKLPPVIAGLKRYYDGGAVGEGEAWDLAPYQYNDGEELPPQLMGKTLFSEDGDIFSVAAPQAEAQLPPSAAWTAPPAGTPIPSVGHNYMYDAAGNPIYGYSGPNKEAYWAPPLNH